MVEVRRSKRELRPSDFAMPSQRKLFVLLYAASGAAALVYEITWTRMLTLQMGHTVAAVSTVLAAFMGGLGGGSWIGSRLDRTASMRDAVGPARLRAYATLEILVALFALALPAILAAFVPLLAWAYDDALAPARFGIVRALLCAGLLGVPAAAMGATFPIAAAWFVSRSVPDETEHAPRRSRRSRGPGRSDPGDQAGHPGAREALLRRAPNDDAAGTSAAAAGALYAANAAGAAIGAIAAGFWLLPGIGLRATTYVGAVLNLAAAAGALALARAGEPRSVTSANGNDVPEPSPRAAAPAVSKRRTLRSFDRRTVAPSTIEERHARGERRLVGTQVAVACAAAAISGLVALIYRSRLDAPPRSGRRPDHLRVHDRRRLLHRRDRDLGSAAGARLVRRSARPQVWLGAMLVVTAVAASAAAWFAASRLPLIVASQVADPDAAFGRVVARQAFGIAILLLPMTCALGAVFPLALAAASAGQRPPSAVTRRASTHRTRSAPSRARSSAGSCCCRTWDWTTRSAWPRSSASARRSASGPWNTGGSRKRVGAPRGWWPLLAVARRRCSCCRHGTCTCSPAALISTRRLWRWGTSRRNCGRGGS